MSEFKWRQFEGEVILWAVRWYCRYGISYRDLEQMMGERGVPVDHSTIYRWVQRYAPEIEERLRWQWRRPRGLHRGTRHIFHSDRGSLYANHEFSRVLEARGVTASMSRKGNCWDNAPSEALFASLKVERLHGQRFETIVHGAFLLVCRRGV
jgi:transposase InsO family protein